MAGTVRDSFADLERHRLQLEQNVNKLRASLQHWQAWEIEYEGMKEDIRELADNPSQTDLEGVGNDAGYSLLTAKERRLLLRDDKGNLRQGQQVLGLLSRRVDYIQQNIKTVSSLLQLAEDKYTASCVLSQPEVRNEEGLPLTEIHEELDEEGNVISSSTSEPGKAAPQVVEALRKAGIKELPDTGVPDVQSTEAADKVFQSGRIIESDSPTPKAAGVEQTAPFASISSVPLISDVVEEPSKPKKSVSFAEDTKEEHTPNFETGATSEAQSQAQASSQRSNITLYDEEEDTAFEAVVPENESPEDAALRRQMIDYNMGQVGAIVAELDLDEDDTPYSDDGSEPNGYDNSSAEDDEDNFGRTKRRVLSDEYLAEMQRLEQRLKNIGPGTGAGDLAAISSLAKDQRAGNGMGPQSAAQESTPATKKGVRFANDLDVQEAPITGRSENLPVAPPSATTPVSLDVARTIIHAPTVVERPPSATTNPSTVREPDEFDAALVQQEVSTVYHRMRNRMIQRQGGFTNGDDEDERGEVPLTEAGGGPKKVSRFKAARLNKLRN